MKEKNKEYVGIVANIGSNGEGVIVDDETVVFVPYAITGEKIRYKVLKATSKVCYGKLIEVIEPSEKRVRPKCEVFNKCGGCQLQHIEYEKQLEIKRQNIKNCFSKIANLNVNVSEVITGSKNFRYRNKLQLPVQFDGTKNIFGFYSENSHRVVEITDCLINPEWVKKIISSFKIFMERYNLKGLCQGDFSGDIREITVKEISSKIIITVVGLKKKFEFTDELVGVLKENLTQEFSLFYNYNDSDSNVIYGEKFSLLYGKNEYEDEMNGIKYRIGVRSFSQVNSEVCAKLYKKVVESLKISDEMTVFDAYSGAGIMTAMVAKKAKKVIGIEIVDEAVKIADELMKRNDLSGKVKNYCGKCEELLPKLIREEREKGNKVSVIVDPPRKGCEYKVIEAIRESEADSIVYVSCMPSTLARDVGLLIGSLEYNNREIVKSSLKKPKYAIKEVVPFEMFPMTKHIETLVVLERVAE